VKVRANDQPFWAPESFWHVKSTGRRDADIQLGRKYARLTIAAMKADRDQHLVAHVIHDIIKDATKKTGKSGIRSPISLGFLTELSEVIAAEP